MTGSRTPERAAAHRKIARTTAVEGAAGDCLLDGIDAVLRHLAAPTPPPADRLVDELRLALARTAARGDTCRVPNAADGVRVAAGQLLAGETERARRTLRDARRGLAGAREGQASGAAFGRA